MNCLFPRKTLRSGRANIAVCLALLLSANGFGAPLQKAGGKPEDRPAAQKSALPKPLAHDQPLQLTLHTPKLIYPLGEPPILDVSLYNASSIAQRADLFLTSSLPDVVPHTLSRIKIGLLPPGASRAFRFVLRVPLLSRDTNTILHITVGKTTTQTLEIRLPATIRAAMDPIRQDLEAPGKSALFQVRLSNLGSNPLLVEIHPTDLPATAQDRLVLRKGEPGVRMLTLTPIERAPGNHVRHVAIDSAQGRITTLTAVVGVPLLVRPFAQPPMINADLAEWTDSEPMGMGRAEQTHGKKWRGPADLSAIAYVRWDAQYLYFAANVTDDEFVPPSSENDLARGDSLVFAISRDRTRPMTAQDYTPGDAEFGMALVRGIRPVLRRSWGAAPFASGPVPGAQVAIRHEGNRLFYEAAIPWSQLMPSPPTPGDTFGFSILLHDTDGIEHGVMEWGGGIFPEKRPGLFIPIRLVP